ncbi:MAG: hypothetical protein ACYTBZ_09880 [Planctomycetota bacterium]|jgi:hypothetical protein
MADLDEQDLLLKCPFCKYSLRGLPIKHRCPECGQEFDRRWEIFGGLPRWHSLSKPRQIGTIIFLALLVGISIDRIYFYPVLKHEIGFGLFLMILFLVYFTRLVFSRPPIFIAVGPGAIAVGNRKKKSLDRYSWSQVGEVQLDVKHTVLLSINGQNMKLDAWRGNVVEAERFVDYVNEYKEKRDT